MRLRARRVNRTMVRGTISGRRRGAVRQGLGGVGVSAPAGPPGAARRGSPRKRFRGITSPRRLLSDIAVAGQGRRASPSSPLPPSGGRSGGGSAPGCAGVPPASREARTGPRRRVGSEGKDAGLRPAMPAGRRRSQAIHGWAGSGRSPSGPPSPWVNPPPDLPPSRGEERRRGGPPPCSAIESGSQRDPDSFSLPGARSEDARRSYLEILRRLADIAVAGQERTRGLRFLSSPLQGGGREGGPAPGCAASRRPRAKRERGRGPSARQAGGTPAHPGGSRMSGTGKVPVRAAVPPGSTPLPTSPLPGGRREDPGGRREDGAARLPVRPSRAPQRGTPTPPPVQRRGVKTESQVRSPCLGPRSILTGADIWPNGSRNHSPPMNRDAKR